MIGILCFNSLRYAQYVYKYTDILDSNSIPYELVYWNREGDSIPKGSNWIGYKERLNTFQPFYRKIIAFLRYIDFLKKRIAEKKYDRLIVLTSQTSVSLYRTLIRKYKGKYIYDYRDVTYENFFLYKLIVRKLIRNSCFTAISSNGFLHNGYFSKKDGSFVISHNTRVFEKKELNHNKNNRIRVVYWGMVRQVEYNKKICDYFANKTNIDLIYHGAGFHKELAAYCSEKKYKNIVFTGAYSLEEISSFVKETDFILNTYENDKVQQSAMTVKFYDSIMYGIPMIVTKGSYMSKLVNKEGLGVNINLDQPFEDFLREISSFDYNLYSINVDKIYNRIKREDSFFEMELLKFVR